VERFQRLGEQLAREGDELRVTVGTMLSGGARIESGAYREELVGHVPALEPPIVGGEMEAMGAISAALTDPEEPGWIVVKGVADFADAESRAVIEQTRKVAARAAATVVLRALAEAGTLV
jgi:adenosylhomocysteine nucleosidase